MDDPVSMASFMGLFSQNTAFLKQLVEQYGLTGILISSFIGSTIFVPLSVELLLPILIKAHINLYLIIIFASVGALVGSWVNYAFGCFGYNLVKARIGTDKLEKASRIMDKYGTFGLFFIIFVPLPLPIPVDPITVIPGIAKMDFTKFSIVVFLAKLFWYALVVGILNGILNYIA